LAGVQNCDQTQPGNLPCPTTTKIKGYPFEVKLYGRPASVALADQIKSFDWRARKAQKKG